MGNYRVENWILESGARSVRNRWILVMFGLLGVVLVAVGCGMDAETPAPTGEVSLSGHFRVKSPAEPMPEEEPVVVSWSGYTAGHRIGATSPFTVSVDNVSDDTEDVRLCLYLLDQDRIVAELGRQRSTVSPSMVLRTEVPAQFPDDIDRGRYGLALVARDSSGADAGVVDIAVGEGAAGRAGVDVPSDVVDEAVEACTLVD